MATKYKSLGDIIANSSSRLLDIDVPTFNFTEGFFIKKDVSSVGEAASGVADSVSNLLQATQITWCLLANFSDFIGGGFNLLAGSVLGVAGQIADRLAALVRGQIVQALGQITGSISNLFNSITSYLNAAVGIADALTDIIKQIANIRKRNWKFFIEEEDCAYVFAAMAACLLNKILGPKLTELEQKVSKKIIEVGSDLNDSIADSVKDANVVSSYIERETFYMNKAEKQIRGLSNMVF
jgi:hypothetical protein